MGAFIPQFVDMLFDFGGRTEMITPKVPEP
jgi:hypothetical protein